ncbi:MAG: hypothetical protein GY950_00725 [bacterium]|nr:hypothetical protein [bacterium]
MENDVKDELNQILEKLTDNGLMAVSSEVTKNRLGAGMITVIYTEDNPKDQALYDLIWSILNDHSER